MYKAQAISSFIRIGHLANTLASLAACRLTGRSRSVSDLALLDTWPRMQSGHLGFWWAGEVSNLHPAVFQTVAQTS